MLVKESLADFKRGLDPKRSMQIGYFERMPEIARELEEEISLEIQMDVALANYPGVETKALEYEGPVYVSDIGLEAGQGLAETSSRIATVSIFIDPFNLKISGEISVMNYDDIKGLDEKEKYYNIEKRDIPDNEVKTMVNHNYQIYSKLLSKANLETD